MSKPTLASLGIQAVALKTQGEVFWSECLTCGWSDPDLHFTERAALRIARKHRCP